MRLREYIPANLEKILQEWEDHAGSFNAGRDLNGEELRDHANQLLHAVVMDLTAPQTEDQQVKKSKGKASSGGQYSQELDEVSKKHGLLRFGSGFSIEDLISEYRALRASVLRLWGESSGPVHLEDLEEMVRFNESIDQAIVSSLRNYSAEKEQRVRLLDTLLSSGPDHACILDTEGKFVYVNKALADQFTKSPSEVEGKSLFDLGLTSAAELHSQLKRVVETKQRHRAEISNNSDVRQREHYEYILTPVINRDGTVEAVTGTARDITERKILDEEIWHKANYDALTGLPNRLLFRDRLERDVKHAERTGIPMALLFIDLDRFKEVNDMLGHDAGDVLLKQAGERIGACIRGTDTLARIGGDEFTVILTDISEPDHVRKVAEKILRELAGPFYIGHDMVNVSGSIGITVYPSDAYAPENLLRNADQAMYVAKKDGRNRYRFFATSMHESVRSRLKMIADLRQALSHHEFIVYYQPIVDLSSGEIHKAEALLRWFHPLHGLLLPGEFIKLAEETGLISDIGNWVFMEAALRSREWANARNMPFQISVNKSPVQFMTQRGGMDWSDHLRQLGLRPDSVSIEITEGVLLNDSCGAAEQLLVLHEAGIELAIDDFGTGYSSMTYLNRFDVDYLKIDQSFVRDMQTDSNSRVIAETIIVMAHKLGMKAIAEGVETTSQKEWLTDAGCDYAQGFLFSEAVPAHQFAKLLAAC